MSKNKARQLIKKDKVVDFGNVYFFKSNGIKSRYSKNTYVIRYANSTREELRTNFNDAWNFAQEAREYKYYQ